MTKTKKIIIDGNQVIGWWQKCYIHTQGRRYNEGYNQLINQINSARENECTIRSRDNISNGFMLIQLLVITYISSQTMTRYNCVHFE